MRFLKQVLIIILFYYLPNPLFFLCFSGGSPFSQFTMSVRLLFSNRRIEKLTGQRWQLPLSLPITLLLAFTASFARQYWVRYLSSQKVRNCFCLFYNLRYIITHCDAQSKREWNYTWMYCSVLDKHTCIVVLYLCNCKNVIPFRKMQFHKLFSFCYT